MPCAQQIQSIILLGDDWSCEPGSHKSASAYAWLRGGKLGIFCAVIVSVEEKTEGEGRELHKREGAEITSAKPQ